MKWWIPLTFTRSFLAALFFLVWTGVLSIFVVSCTIFRLGTERQNDFIHIWSSGVLKMFGVEVKELGRENLIQGPCLYIFTHTSFFDIFAMTACLRGMRFGAKIELFRIPFFGRAMRAAGVLPIARDNREKVFRVYERASVKAANGQQFALAPEGTRNSEEKLLPFKSGPFVFAIGAQMPLLPVIIRGAHDVLPKNGILPNWRKWKSTITLQYLPPVSVQGETRESRPQLQARVYELMKEHYPS